MSPPALHARRKDLQDLRNLSRQPIWSYLRKQTQPRRWRDRAAAARPASYPLLAAFASAKLFVWLWQYISHRLGRRHPFLTYAKSDPDQGLYDLEGGDEIRIALAGDWGTGTDEAECIAGLIKAFKPHYSIHLGDVYYVGDSDEVDENFLGIKNPDNDYQPCLWPDATHGRFALNGNHEMFARGFAYFDRMLRTLGVKSGGRACGQKASFFCLQNEHWRIIALDTGYDSLGWPLIEYFVQTPCALRPEEIDWLRDVVKPRDDDPRGIILLTHHQYYSRFDDWYTKQAEQLAQFFHRPVLWFWGHEHRLAIYPEFGIEGGVRAYGRCIGHGGMPVDLPPAKPPHPHFPVEFVDPRHYRSDEHITVGYNGYAQLILHGEQATVHYVDVEGRIIFSEEWIADQGAVRRLKFHKAI